LTLDEAVIDNFLDFFWCRLESGLWRTIDCFSLQTSGALDLLKNSRKTLDLGCGDGCFWFLAGGGKFHPKFDFLFQATENLAEFYRGKDVFDDSLGKEIPIIKRSKVQFYRGFDIKSTLLSKADMLGVYRKLIQGDANNNEFVEAEIYDYIFSNIIYWLDDLPKIFAGIHKSLSDGGKFVFFMPVDRFLECRPFGGELFLDSSYDDFVRAIDRGRFVSDIKNVLSEEEIRAMLGAAGLKVRHCSPHLTMSTIKLWDVGMRPFFPLLSNMAKRINTHDYLEVKNTWLKDWGPLLKDLIVADRSNISGENCCFKLYICEKY